MVVTFVGVPRKVFIKRFAFLAVPKLQYDRDASPFEVEPSPAPIRHFVVLYYPVGAHSAALIFWQHQYIHDRQRPAISFLLANDVVTLGLAAKRTYRSGACKLPPDASPA